MSRGVTFTVYGRPQPAGSKRAFAIRKDGVPTGQIAVVDANPTQKSWQQEVALVAKAAADGTVFGKGTPVRLEVCFTLARPKSHYGTGRNEGQVKGSAPACPTGAPDTTKLLRAVEDAITAAGVWHDDSQVVEQEAWKVYGWPECCVVRVVALYRTLAAEEVAA